MQRITKILHWVLKIFCNTWWLIAGVIIVAIWITNIYQSRYHGVYDKSILVVIPWVLSGMIAFFGVLGVSSAETPRGKRISKNIVATVLLIIAMAVACSSFLPGTNEGFVATSKNGDSFYTKNIWYIPFVGDITKVETVRDPVINNTVTAITKDMVVVTVESSIRIEPDKEAWPTTLEEYGSSDEYTTRMEEMVLPLITDWLTHYIPQNEFSDLPQTIEEWELEIRKHLLVEKVFKYHIDIYVIPPAIGQAPREET